MKHRIAKLTLYTSLYICTGFIIYATCLLPRHRVDQPFFVYIRIVIIFFSLILLMKYALYMIVCPWYDLLVNRRRTRIVVRRYEPLVSVIIPAWNEEVGLLATIKTLLASTYRNMELVIVNDGSTDGSDRMMREFVQKYERETGGLPGAIRLIYYYKQNGGKGAALNTGIQLAHGEIFISIDADCIVKEDAIEHFVRCFRDSSVMAAVGNVKVGNTRSLIGAIQQLEYLFSFYFKKADSMMNTIYIIGGAAGAFRREVFERLGPYNTKNITEDIELSVRIQKAGMRIVYAPEAIITTEGASDLRGLMKQRLRWKRGRFETFRDHRDLFFSVKKEHNKLLTWIVLPMAAFGDVQLSLELIFVAVLYVFSYLSSDYSAFVSGVLVVSTIFFIQMFENKQTRKPSFLLLAPIGWMLFYITTFVEFNALVKSLWGLLRKRELKWQAWQRKGAID